MKVLSDMFQKSLISLWGKIPHTCASILIYKIGIYFKNIDNSNETIFYCEKARDENVL